MAELNINNVTKRYGDFTAVSDFNLRVSDGEFVSLLGPSGCGKTSLLRSIAGFFPISGGEIRIGDRAVSSVADGTFVPPEKRNLGMVFQSYAVWPHMDVFDNIAYPLKVRKWDRPRIRERVQEVLDLLSLDGQENKNPSELSGGQQQRVALGRALVMDPDALLLDEPLSNLDAKLRDRMRFELKEIQRRLRLTILYVTHDQDEAMAVSDRIVLMEAGRIRQLGTPQEIYQRPANLFSAQFMGRSNSFVGALESAGAGRCTIALPDGKGKISVTPANDIGALLGQSVEAVVRFQDIAVGREAKQGTLPAKVVVYTYLGGMVFYDIDTDAGRVVAQTSSDTLYQEGEEVYLRLENVHIFPTDDQ